MLGLLKIYFITKRDQALSLTSTLTEGQYAYGIASPKYKLLTLVYGPYCSFIHLVSSLSTYYSQNK